MKSALWVTIDEVGLVNSWVALVVIELYMGSSGIMQQNVDLISCQKSVGDYVPCDRL